ncbi:MAG: hypothetical protein ACRDE2_07425 [Chitinophagaceae bacterium]
MNKDYHFNGYTIEVSINPKIVHLSNDVELEHLLSEYPVSRSQALVRRIKEDYLNEYHEELMISDDSMMIEIWGHVYFEYFTVLATRIFPLEITDKFADWVIRRCVIIDSGEKDIDIDRRLWDSLVPFREVFVMILSNVPLRQ